MAIRESRGNLGSSIEELKKQEDKELRKWAKAMLQNCRPLDDVPAGWYSREQLAQKLNFAPSGIGPHILKLVKRGMVEKRKYKTSRGKDGRAMKVTYYRLRDE